MTPFFLLVVALVIMVSSVITIAPFFATTTTNSNNAYGQQQPTDWNAEIDKCMISLKAENTRPAHLLECDEFMPMVPQMIAVDVIHNTSDVTQKVDEYLTQRSLEAYTEEEMEQKATEAEAKK